MKLLPSGYTWERPGWIPMLFILTVVLVMGGLGVWQLQRLHWKQALIAEIDAANASEPLAELPNGEVAQRNAGFRKVQLEGHFLNQYEFDLAARYYRGELGYHILTLFELKDGRIVLINRGWVPTEMKESATRQTGQIEGDLSLVAMLRPDRDYTWFTPQHDVAKNIWFWKDIPRIAKETGLPVEPVALDALYMKPEGGFPVALDGDISLRNDHLGYALTWFSIAFIGVVMFILFHLKKPEETTANNRTSH